MIRATEPAGVWALVPVKRLDRAKSRLSPHLTAAERAMLAGAMLRDVFEAIVGAEMFAGILVVTGDANAAALARDAGATVLDDRHESGTNAAVREGVAWLLSRDVSGVVIVPGDIPFATGGELRAVLSAMRSKPIVLVPATRDGGTNVLAMTPPDRIAPAFGDSSFSRHCEGAALAGVTPSILVLEGAGNDIDVAGDLLPADVPSGGRRTRALLAGLRLAGMPAEPKPAQRVALRGRRP